LDGFLRIGGPTAQPAQISRAATTRRAAKMVCLDLDHPDIEMFVNWDGARGAESRALAEGFKHLSKVQQDAREEARI
jgi:ribonucleoside-diphosphate reductase alpha chain